MGTRGHFLELSLPTRDIRESLDFYRRLGFAELPVNDIRPHYYAVVTDGRIALGLHSEGFDEPALSFVWPDLAHQVGRLEDAGVNFTLVELGPEVFNEAATQSEDGHAVRFVEARTFSRHRFDDTSAPVIGRSTEIVLRCRDYVAAIDFWSHTDLIRDDEEDPGDDRESVVLRAPGVVLKLRKDFRWSEPALRFLAPDLRDTEERLDRLDIGWRLSGEGSLIIAPEGTRLLVEAG